MAAAIPLHIDFVSDVSCPWCAVGLAALEQAVSRLGDTVQAQIHPQPFELNPQLPAEGEDATAHLVRKYGITAAQIEANRAVLRARGEAVGFAFHTSRHSRVYNTFDAHRLLHWAAQNGRDLALKHALLRAYFTERENVASHDTLARVAGSVGLDTARARRVLASNDYVGAVREREQYYLDRGIRSVPATILNGREIVAGGQPPAVFEQALRRAVASMASEPAIVAPDDRDVADR